MLILLIGVITTIKTFSQGRPREDHFRIGFTYTRVQRFGTTKFEIAENEYFTVKYTSKFPGINLPVGFRSEIGRRWMLGIDAAIGKFLFKSDDDPNTEFKNSQWKLGLASEFNLLNRNDSRIFIGAVLSRALSVSTTSINFPSSDSRYAYRGNTINCVFSFVKFAVGRNLGFYAAIDLMASRMKFFAYNQDKNHVIVKGNDITQNDFGFGLTAGICLRHFKN